METKTTYPIGQQDFKTLRKNGSVYVDKTHFIEKLITSNTQYCFLARPRRFGKSLFLSTLKYFFEGERELFAGLHADNFDWNWETYPVLHLDLNTDRFSDKDMLEDVLERLFCLWEEKFEIDTKDKSYSQRFASIITRAHIKTGRKVVILVDEYDKPLVGNLNNDENFEIYRNKLASIYSNFKSCAEHIQLVFITGVSRFSKLSVFSDLNNLKDLSFSDQYADICGITEKELLSNFQVGIRQLAEKLHITYEEACQRLKENYDGYRFTPEGSDIYNPWSILNCLSDLRIGNFWNMTGIPTIIAETLKKSNEDLEESFNTECSYHTLEGLDLKSADNLALLYQTGYITIKDYDPETDICTMGIPNKEVSSGLFKVLVPYYVKARGESTESLVRKLQSSISTGKPDKMMEYLQSYFAGIPYELKIEDENNFQNAFFILTSLIGARIMPEVHTSDGRIDLLIESQKYIYIIELKYDSTAEKAIQQIEEKQYALPFKTDGRQVFIIGANFSSKRRAIEDWIIRED